jgi:protein phosphatase
MERREDRGPFDIIGDIHGCAEELTELLERLGYVPAENGAADDLIHPEGRRVIFLGDLVDRGPDAPGVLRRAMAMVASAQALCLPGNHDDKLLRKLRGRNVKIAHGLAETLEQLEREPLELREAVAAFLGRLPSHYVLDGGRLVVAHAGMPLPLQGQETPRARSFALYGETTGGTDVYGLPVRGNWALRYRGRAAVVYGHTPVAEPCWLHNTLNIDTGCVFGGRLTALRYPERQLVAVPARRAYASTARPFLTSEQPDRHG